MSSRRFSIVALPLLVGALLLVGHSRRAALPAGTTALVVEAADGLGDALSVVGPREATAAPCKGTQDTCRTPQSCCSRRCVKAGNAKFGECRPVCRCGDGFLDPSCGEACDDGNNAVCDGCSATCQIEACDDGVPCTDDSCDPATGACRFVPNHGNCDDFDDSTIDRCEPGCDPEFASCDPETGCVHRDGGCGCS